MYLFNKYSPYHGLNKTPRLLYEAKRGNEDVYTGDHGDDDFSLLFINNICLCNDSSFSHSSQNS